ncbi:MAG TPA: hypothetical protein VGF28_08175 [Thermoanaerobaculia bacterium]|jgi:hypothetical protein
MRTRDDGVRGTEGVCISVRQLDGEIELTIDDVRLQDNDGRRHRTWHHKTFVTFASMTPDEAAGRMSAQRHEDLGRFLHGLLVPLMTR